MKNSILLLIALLVGFSATAQTTSSGLQPTKYVETSAGVGKIIDDTWAALQASQDDVYYAAYFMRAPSLEKKNGGGVGIFWKIQSLDSTNVSVSALAGTRLDYVNGGFWMPSGNVSIEMPVKAFAWTGVPVLKDVAVIPLGYVGVGVPISGAKVGNFTIPGTIRNNNGDPTAITGYGLAVRLLSYKSVTFSAAYDHEKWSGFDGMQDRFGLVLHYQRAK